MPSFSRPSLNLVGEAYVPSVAPSLTPDRFPATEWADIQESPAAGRAVEAWRLEALCAETDPEAFFPEKGGSTRDAKRVCTGCPVRAECLDFALANDERFGIWGGLSERERRRLRLHRRGALSA